MGAESAPIPVLFWLINAPSLQQCYHKINSNKNTEWRSYHRKMMGCLHFIKNLHSTAFQVLITAMFVIQQD
jgi:hypothetical protein